MTPVPPPVAPHRGARRIFGLSAIVVLLIAVVVGVLLWRRDDDLGPLTAAPETAALVVDGDPLPALPGAGELDEGVLLPAPALRGVDFDGEPITITGNGAPQMIVFMAHWSPECQRQVPLILRWAAQNELPGGLQIVGVSTGADATKEHHPPSQWLRELGWKYPLLVDSTDNDAASAYALPSYPYVVIIDGEGLVKVRFSGELDLEQFDALVRATIAN